MADILTKINAATEASNLTGAKLLGTQAGAKKSFGGALFEPAQIVASQVEAEAGTEAELRSWSPLRIAQAVAALETGGGGSPAWDDITDKPATLALVTVSGDGLYLEVRNLAGTLIGKAQNFA